MPNIQTYICKNGKITYKAKVRLKGHRSKTATFDSIEDAKDWAFKLEKDIKLKRAYSDLDENPNQVEHLMLCIPLYLAEKIKFVAERGHRSEFIIKLIEDYFSKVNLILNETNKKPRFVSVKNIPELYPAFTVGSIRNLIFNCHEYKFTKCFNKIRGKIVIDLDEFDNWIKNIGSKSQLPAPKGAGLKGI